MNKLLSIIVPCYNVEKYIITCLDSIYSKNLDDSIFEVIVIDDESPDQVVKVASEYLTDKKNCKIIRQKNKGLGGARNTGIENAVGKFIIFMDPDDTLVLEKYDFLESCNAKIVQLASENISTFGEVISTYNPPDIVDVKGRDFWLNNVIMPSACNKLYLRSFLEEYDIKFLNHVYSEDIEFNARAFFYADNVAAKNTLIQRFLQSPNSITRNKDIKSRKKLFNDLFTIIERLILFREKHSKTDQDVKYFNKIISDIGLGLLHFGLQNSIEKSEIYRLKYYLFENKVPIFTIVYDNKLKNIFKYILRIPYAIPLLYTVLKK